LEKFSAKRAEASADKRLSDVGRTDHVREFAATLASPVAKARTAVFAAKNALQKQRCNAAGIQLTRPTDLVSAWKLQGFLQAIVPLAKQVD
jgi:hypothetical protein